MQGYKDRQTEKSYARLDGEMGKESMHVQYGPSVGSRRDEGARGEMDIRILTVLQ